MGFRTALFAVLVCCANAAFASQPLPNPSAEAFVENRGQWDSDVQFLMQTPGVDQWLTSRGPVMDFYQQSRADKSPQARRLRKGSVVRMSFVGATPTLTSASKELHGKLNYFHGASRDGWVTGVRRFAEARAEQPYRGISVRYYIENHAPRYDVIVKPGADPSQFGMKIEGANGVRVLDNGDLAFDTAAGTVEEKGLTAYQTAGNQKLPVPCQMTTEGNIVRFAPGAYDPAKPLVIDPLVFSTFIGPNYGNTNLVALGLTKAGNPVVGGSTTCPAYPVTTGSYQKTDVSAYFASYVAELNPTGTELEFATYLTGDSSCELEGLAVDSANEPVVVGSTFGGGFPTTTGAYQTKQPVGGSSDNAFVSKLSADGSSLVFSTLLGGNYQDGANAVALDSHGNVFVTGFVTSLDFPTTTGAFQKTLKGAEAAFAAEFDPTGSKLMYSTLLGGSESDEGLGIAVDSSGYAYVCGKATSTDFPVTSGAYQKTNKTEKSTTAFVTKVNSTGTGLVYSTYLGGSSNDVANGLAVDTLDRATVVGATYSTDFPITAGAFQSKNMGAAQKEGTGFVTMLNASGSALVESTYLGGSGFTDVNAVTFNSSGYPVVTGFTETIDFPVTAGAYQSSTVGVGAFVTEIKSGAGSLAYSSAFGPGPDSVGVCINPSGQAVIAGGVEEANIPVTSGAYQTQGDPYADGFVACLSLTPQSGNNLIDFTIQPSVLGGQYATGFATLNGAAAAGVSLEVIGIGPATFPSGVTISKGQSFATISILANTVTSSKSATVTVRYGATSFTRTFLIALPSLVSVNLSASTVQGGNSFNALVTASGDAGADNQPITISTTGPISTAASKTILAGSNVVYFEVSTSPVSVPTQAIVKATMGSSTVSRAITVEPPTMQTFTTSSTTISSGGTSGYIALTGIAGSTGIVIQLSTTGPISVSPTVKVLGGQDNVSFNVSASTVTKNTPATITAKLGSQTITVDLTVTP
jgi:hypothetical protein